MCLVHLDERTSDSTITLSASWSAFGDLIVSAVVGAHQCSCFSSSFITLRYSRVCLFVPVWPVALCCCCKKKCSFVHPCVVFVSNRRVFSDPSRLTNNCNYWFVMKSKQKVSLRCSAISCNRCQFVFTLQIEGIGGSIQREFEHTIVPPPCHPVCHCVSHIVHERRTLAFHSFIHSFIA